MFAELEIEYRVISRPGNMGLEVWGKSAQNVSRRTFAVLAGSLATAGLLYLFFRDRDKKDKSHEEEGEKILLCEREHEEENDGSGDDISVTDDSQPRGDESLIEWIDRQLKEAEERKKLKQPKDE